MTFLMTFSMFSDALSVLTCVASSYAAFRLWNQNRRLKEMVKQMPVAENVNDMIRLNEGKKSISPVALALSLTPQAGSIENAVKTFLKSKDWNMPIEEINMDGINGREGIAQFINEVKKKKRLIEATGYTEVHLFISGPVQAGTLIGAFFDNWLPVKLYHKPTPAPPQLYEYWSPLFKN